jgi:hypothetical protein
MNGQKDALEHEKEKFRFPEGQEYGLGYDPGIEVQGYKGEKGPAQHNIKGAARQEFPKKPCKPEQKNCRMDLQGPFMEYGRFQPVTG